VNSSDLIIGWQGEGWLNIQSGGQAESNGGNLGQYAGSLGSAAVTGAGSWWKANGVVAVGVEGGGELTITDGGKVTSVNGRIARETNSTGSVTIDGPSSQWNCTGVLTVATVSGPSSNGTLALLNGGSVSALGGLTVSVGGKLQGSGVVAANVTNNWHVAPGTSPGVLQVSGNYSQHSILGQLEIDLVSAASFDKLVVTGNASLAGVLRVKLLDGYVPVAGTSFDVLDWGSRTGTFSTLNLPPLPAPLAWNTSQLYTSGVLSVTAPFLAGDFDENGPVNSADFTKWKMGFGTAAGATHMQGNADFDADVDGGDFLIWQREFGLPGAVGAGAPVPELRTAMLFLLGWVTAWCWAPPHARGHGKN
jgi:T5SS/PEP-CTERM-associated repeat protein